MVGLIELKFNKYNLYHYIYSLILGLSCTLGLFLILFYRKNNLVIITSPKLSGNAEAFYLMCKENKIQARFLTTNLNDYKLLKSKKIKVMFYLNPFHVAKVFKSQSILATHGIYFISFIKLFSKTKLINIRHGVITIGKDSNLQNKTKFIKHSKKFDKYCFLSEKELQIVQNHLSHEFSNNFIFEFPHIEYVKKLSLNKQNLKKKMELNSSKKYILIANTDIRNNTDTKNSVFSIYNIEYLAFLDNLVENLDAKVILKPHWKTKFNSSEKKMIRSFKNIIYREDLIKNFDSELKAISDILITDWSTVYIDVLKNIKEIMFVNNSYPDRQRTNNTTMENKFINRVETFTELQNNILKSINLDNQSKTVLGLRSLFLQNSEKDLNKLIYH